MIKILANDGIHPDGRLLLEEAAYVVDEDKIPQEALADRIAEYDVLIVRSATKVNKAVIEAGKNLKVIARGGVGLDNIDLEYAQSKGIQVFNTPMASSRAVAELAIAHLFSLSRMLHRSNRELASGGDFKKLKKAYETGFQIKGKTLGIIGFGRIGQEVAKIALGEADAGVVYLSDVTPDTADAVITIDIPDAVNTLASYPIAITNDSALAELAQAFVDFVLSDDGQAVLTHWNFIGKCPDIQMEATPEATLEAEMTEAPYDSSAEAGCS